MDDADETDRAYERIAAAARKMLTRTPGAEPLLVTYCLHCHKPIERVRLKDLKDGKMVKRFCCIACRDAFQRGEVFEDDDD